MISVIHPLLSYVVAAIFMGNPRLRLASFFGGLMPDIDGITYFSDKELYYKYHHEILHPPFAGLLAALIVFYLYEKKKPEERKGAAAFFMLGFLAHVVADIFTTNWPVNLIAPFGKLYVSASPWLSDGTIFGIIAPLMTASTLVLLAALLIKERFTSGSSARR